LKLLKYESANSLEEAYALIQEDDNLVLGGVGWLKLTHMSKSIGVDLEKLGLNYIRKEDNTLIIGAMTPLRTIELDASVTCVASGILAKSASMIMGVNLRNIVTIGGTVCGKYGFSDLLTPLLALNAKLRFYKTGVISLEDFLQSKDRQKDILVEVLIPIEQQKGYFEAYKKTSLDFSLVNVAIACNEEVVIAIGARPAVASCFRIRKDSDVFRHMSEVLSQGHSIELNEIIEGIVQDFNFGTNPRASKEYRFELAKNYVLHGLKEVLL
jgi:CO/xanthine dehydrogenase FAD-binding subunit